MTATDHAGTASPFAELEARVGGGWIAPALAAALGGLAVIPVRSVA